MKKHQKYTLKKGFTFIEMIVTLTIIALVLPALFSMLFVIVQQQVKVYRLTQVKRDGDFILNTIETNLRNSAVTIYNEAPPVNQVCAPLAGQLTNTSLANSFKDKFGNWFQYKIDSNRIASISSLAVSTNQYLSSTKTSISSFSIKCLRQSYYTNPIITVSFTIDWNSNGVPLSPQESASMNYQTRILLKNGE